MTIDPDLLIVFTSNEIGNGPSDLGEKLTGLSLKVLTGSETRPAMLIFLNSAIFLTTEGSPVLDHLRALEAEGTEIVSCVTCLNYHDRMERLLVGRAGDMKAAVSAMLTHPRVITL
jgi:hypothetical protein